MTIQQNYPNIRPSLSLDFANTKQLDPRITYSRASTGTYYDGKTTAKAEENLLTQSGNVAVWSQPLGISRTANATVAPDGTTTAGLVTVDSSTGRHFVGSNRGGVAPIGSIITGSIFLKANTYNFACVQLSNATSGTVTPRHAISVDLSNGTIGGFTFNFGVSGQTASVASVGNGWYRIILTMTTTLAGDGEGMNLLVTPMPTNGSAYPDGGALLPSFTGDGTSGIFVWGAQVELRSTATAYTPTTTAPITNYIPVLQTASAGTPRFDHNPITGESLGLLIEEQRTNLVTYSSDFDNPAWSKTRASVIANAILAPDGTIGADKAVEDTSTGTHVVAQSVTLGNGLYTASISIKAAERTFALFQMSDLSTGGALVFVNLTTGSVVSSTGTGSWTSVSGTVINQGNGWYRVNVTGTKGAGTVVSVQVFPSTDGTTTSYTGNGTSGVYIWGAQLEAGAFATSYIPTVASQVTRAADSASMTGTNFSSWYNQSEGTLYGEAAYFGTGYLTTKTLVRVSTDNSNYMSLFSYGATTGAIGSSFEMYTGSTSEKALSKQALAYAVNNFATVRNAGTVMTDSSGNVPFVTSMGIGQHSGNYNTINGYIRKIAYYPRRLNDTQLQALTS